MRGEILFSDPSIPDAVGEFWHQMQDDQAKRRDWDSFEQFAEECLWIRDDNDNLIPLILKSIQKVYRQMKADVVEAGKRPWYLVVKARRVGVTTEEMAENYYKMETESLQHIISVADKTKNSKNIFRMMNRFYDHRDVMERPTRSDSRTNLEFPQLDNIMEFDTGLGKSVARGGGISKVHFSEAARVKVDVEEYQDTMSGFTAACKYGEIVLESTTQGAAGWFWEEVQKSLNGNSPYSVIFLPWFLDDTNVVDLLPGEVITRTEEEIRRSDQLGPWSDEQLKYRRAKQFEHGRLFPQEYPETIEEAFLTQEGCWFDVETCKAKIGTCLPSVEQHENGHLLVWRQPIEGERYFIGADTAEGLASGDASTAGVLDSKGRQCASLHGRWATEIFGKKLAALGTYYENAVIAVEANNHGHSVINTLKNTEQYRNLFVHQSYDSDSPGKVGFQTNAKTRPMILDAIRDEAVEGNAMEINDRMFLGEAMTFCINKTGTKYEALEGSHDDRVMAWAIAWWIRKTAPRKARVWVL